MADAASAGDDVDVAARAGARGAVPVLAGTESRSFRSALRMGVEAPAGLRVDVGAVAAGAGDELRVVAGAGTGTGAVVPVCAGTESGVAAGDGVEVVACGAAGGVALARAGFDAGGSVLAGAEFRNSF
jgi:hypothetical protein